jgi:prolyl-tRNA synthetase
MKDSYSLDADWDGLDRQYQNHYQAYFNIFNRCGIDVLAVKSDSGMMGGKLAHEFMYITPFGEDTLILCPNCGYAANRQIAVFRKTALPKEDLLEREKVATPDTKTITDLAEFLSIPESHTAKAVFLMATFPEQEPVSEKFVFAILRGDMELNETKLTNTLRALDLRPATEEEISAVGAVPGYASPIGISKLEEFPLVTIVDDLIPQSTNLVAGANEIGFHFRNTNYNRDFKADMVADICAAREGDQCMTCNTPLKSIRGVEVGNIFKLGTHYSEAMGATFQDKDGSEKPIIMGSYGIGSGRLMASIAEEHNDDWGLIWPISVAPYHVHLVVLPHKKDQGVTIIRANQLFEELQSAGIEVLLDDRDESPGVKFNDADLIGLPLRVTVSWRGISQGVCELKRRDHDKSQKMQIPLSNAVETILSEKAELDLDISSRLVAVSSES